MSTSKAPYTSVHIFQIHKNCTQEIARKNCCSAFSLTKEMEKRKLISKYAPLTHSSFTHILNNYSSTHSPELRICVRRKNNIEKCEIMHMYYKMLFSQVKPPSQRRSANTHKHFSFVRPDFNGKQKCHIYSIYLAIRLTRFFSFEK